jgi:hypothetical protein
MDDDAPRCYNCDRLRKDKKAYGWWVVALTLAATFFAVQWVVNSVRVNETELYPSRAQLEAEQNKNQAAYNLGAPMKAADGGYTVEACGLNACLMTRLDYNADKRNDVPIRAYSLDYVPFQRPAAGQVVSVRDNRIVTVFDKAP